jgi:hypothetical protein
MASHEDAAATQLHNIVSKTGKSVEAWAAALAASDKQSHGDIRSWLKDRAGLGYGDANALAFAVRSLVEARRSATRLMRFMQAPGRICGQSMRRCWRPSRHGVTLRLRRRRPMFRFAASGSLR